MIDTAYITEKHLGVSIDDHKGCAKFIKAKLLERGGIRFSVRTVTSGSAFGWIHISGKDEQLPELNRLLSLPENYGSASVPSSRAHRREYMNRAAGLPFTNTPAYWD